MKTRNTVSTPLVVLFSVLIAILIVMTIFFKTQTSLVKMQEEVFLNQAQVQTQLQRKSDLIPSLLEVLNNEMAHEQELYREISKASNNLAECLGKIDVFEAYRYDQQLNQSINVLVSRMANYPEINSDEHVTAIMDEIAGTENRISIARDKYNESVSRYNQYAKVFPHNIISILCGYTEFKYFEAK